MTTLEPIILSFLANALWQVPLIFGTGWLAARALRSLGAAAEHRLWVGVLLLQTLLPAISTIPREAVSSLFNLFSAPLNTGQPYVSIAMGPGTTFANPHVPAWLLALLTVVYGVVTAWFVIRFLWRLYTTHLLGTQAAAVILSADAARHWNHCANRFSVKSATLGTSAKISGPITIGIRRKLVLLPTDMYAALPDAEFRTAIAHEFAHLSRHDFLKNLLYEMLSLPVRFHPVISLTQNRLKESREMVCDRLAAGLANEHQYARSLLRLASLLVDGMPARSPHAIGIFDSTTFERRVMRLTEKPIQISGLRRLTTLAVCSMIGTGICATTVALSVHVDALAAIDEHALAQHAGAISISPEIMQNQIIHKVPPIYPEDAKKARIQGKVQLNAVISKTGEIEQLRVVSGPKELQQSSLDAVRQWIYKPYLLNGEPVEVKTTINVIYTLKK
jgi:TonB family protein